VESVSEPERDLGSIRLPRWGRVVAADGVGPWVVIDPAGEPVGPVSQFLRDFVAQGNRPGSVRSCAYDLLRWWRWLQVVPRRLGLLGDPESACKRDRQTGSVLTPNRSSFNEVKLVALGVGEGDPVRTVADFVELGGIEGEQALHLGREVRGDEVEMHPVFTVFGSGTRRKPILGPLAGSAGSTTAL